MRAQARNVILGTDRIGKTLLANAHPPADLAPVRAGGAEFLRLRALSAIAADDAEGSNARVAEREDDVAGRDLPHELVEGIPVSVLVALWRPEVPALDLLAEGLILIDPPIAHAPKTDSENRLMRSGPRACSSQAGSSPPCPWARTPPPTAPAPRAPRR